MAAEGSAVAGVGVVVVDPPGIVVLKLVEGSGGRAEGEMVGTEGAGETAATNAGDGEGGAKGIVGPAGGGGPCGEIGGGCIVSGGGIVLG